MTPKLQVQLKIRKPVAEVFQAVVDPKKLSGYFIKDASGPLVAGQTVTWRFPEMPDQPFDVVCREVVENEKIVFAWPVDESPGERQTVVEMVFKPLEDGSTMMQVSEDGWADGIEGIQASQRNAGGWMHMMAAMKGYLEYGINLREGGCF